MSKVSIVGLDRADVLAALYNAARPQGMGFMHYDQKPMTTGEADAMLKSGQSYFDYVSGRIMKVDLSSDKEVNVALYDRDNGVGAGQKTIDSLRGDGINSPDIQKQHVHGRSEAAADTRNVIDDERNAEKKVGCSVEQEEDGTITMHLGIGDLADNLESRINKVKGN